MQQAMQQALQQAMRLVHECDFRVAIAALFFAAVLWHSLSALMRFAIGTWRACATGFVVWSIANGAPDWIPRPVVWVACVAELAWFVHVRRLLVVCSGDYGRRPPPPSNKTREGEGKIIELLLRDILDRMPTKAQPS